MLLATIIMHILLYAFIVDVIYAKTVLGLEIERRYQVDLIEGLHIFNATYNGVHTDVGVHSFSPAISLQGESRNLKLPDDVFERATQLLSSNNEFTLLATLQQEEKNAGSIIAFSQGNNRFLELQSSARKDEIRLHYTHKDSVYVEIFPYRLADGRWHRLAVTVSGNHVTILVDCNRIYERVIKDVDRKVRGKNITLWLGQRNSKHFYFKGGLQDVKIIAKEHGYIMQCPHLDTECPTCGQFRQVQMAVVHLENYIKELTDRLMQAENRISVVEQCECHRRCWGNGTLHADGSVWQQGCDNCSCMNGQIQCRPIQCQAHCKNPVYKPGECCPTCLKQCLLDKVKYDHGEETSPRECQTCLCHDGRMHCNRTDPELHCPKLTCPKEEQFSEPGKCCHFCRGVDYCAQGHNCHVNATCVNLDTRSTCRCVHGFDGDGKDCQDVDECANNGGHDGHHCQRNTKCVNTMGSYVCECSPGYRRVDTFNCAEYDECKNGDHQCHENAVCINTAGSYHCQCKSGYQGDGFSCEPVCDHPCLNGGKCLSPGVCSCRKGYFGPSCELDVDECALGIHQCHSNSQCVNLPGWYYCVCKQGYYSYSQDNNLGTLCQDINECEIGSHTCHGTARCVNKNGNFHCQCRENTSCSLNCIYDEVEWRNGAVWSPFNNTCTKCSCQGGFASCERDPCDCNDSNVNMDCCPHCDRTTRCLHQEHPTWFENGQRWIYQCQLCECLYGEIDCWPVECPTPNCDNPTMTEGDCCARCEDDPCSMDEQDGINATQGCTHMGQVYRHGDHWEMPQDRCTTCKCKNGHMCCTFSATCASSLAAATNVATGRDAQVRTGLPDVNNTEVAGHKTSLPVSPASTSENITKAVTSDGVVMKSNTTENSTMGISFTFNISAMDYLNDSIDSSGTSVTEVLPPQGSSLATEGVTISVDATDGAELSTQSLTWLGSVGPHGTTSAMETFTKDPLLAGSVTTSHAPTTVPVVNDAVVRESSTQNRIPETTVPTARDANVSSK